ncbi:DNA gyrase subunit A, partial [Escherichia coli]|uniref:DNA gyrase subunit A n=1 Tax=Escherichia coli TaxID=562 RepID=UPI00202281B6
MLAAPYCNNVPYLDGIGSFGTRVAPVEGIGAPRYTYVKKGKSASELMFRDLDIVPLRENYDGSTKEPEHYL